MRVSTRRFNSPAQANRPAVFSTAWRHASAGPPDSCVLGDAPAHGTICREEPVFAGKVTCGVRNETSGQSWPSNTVATDPFTGQNRNSKCGSGIQHKRLGGWRPKTLYLPFQTLRYIGMAARGVLSSLPFSLINLDKGATAAMDLELARWPATAPIAGSQTWTGGPVKWLCRESLVLSTALSSVMSPSKVQL
jgi:hypothetical protein